MRIRPSCFSGSARCSTRGHDQAAVKLVAGAGYGGIARRRCSMRAGSSIGSVVRAPRALLGLPEALASAIRLCCSLFPTVGHDSTVGFMPHFESLACGAWTEAAKAAGMVLIDPTDDPAAIIAAIGELPAAALRGDARRHRCRYDARAMDCTAPAGASAPREMAGLGGPSGAPGAVPAAGPLIAAGAAAHHISGCIPTLPRAAGSRRPAAGPR